jgi:hypothetical protein
VFLTAYILFNTFFESLNKRWDTTNIQICTSVEIYIFKSKLRNGKQQLFHLRRRDSYVFDPVTPQALVRDQMVFREIGNCVGLRLSLQETDIML